MKTGKNDGPSGVNKQKGVKFNSELKRPEQILKDRKVKEKKRLKNQSQASKKKKGRKGGRGGSLGGGGNRKKK